MTDKYSASELEKLTLGLQTIYTDTYTPELLQSVSRQLGRDHLALGEALPFSGVDVWYGYELSWLDGRGKPKVAVGRFNFNCASPNLVESKSFKLYLNSFNQTQFASPAEVVQVMQQDLGNCSGLPVLVELIAPDDVQSLANTGLPGTCIDDIELDIDHYDLKPDLLANLDDAQSVSETLHSHLLRSNCLITNQPDWASVIISYSGPQIDRAALLQYLISFRRHNEFHEQCVERIFTDIENRCGATSLSVQALYTRRGGLDINPFRTNADNETSPTFRVNRQ